MALDRIDRLNSLNNTGTTSTQAVGNTSSRMSGEEYEGVVYEPLESGRQPKPKTLEETKAEVAREEAEAARANLHSRFDGPGVAVELSRDAIKASEEAIHNGGIVKEPSIGAIFGDTFRGILQSIRNFFVNLWMGTPPEQAGADIVKDVAEGEKLLEETVSLSEEADALSEKAVSPMDPAMTFMLDYGGKKLAKNSDLLTQYDRTGHIIGPSPSDRRRILQGEGQVRQY